MKNQKAITLISLVITIVVLIILASVTIYLSLGNNGILTRTKQANQKYQIEQIKEKVEMGILEVQIREENLKNEITIESMLQELLDNNTFENIDKNERLGYIGEYEAKLKYNGNNSIVIESIEKSTGVRAIYKLEPSTYTNEDIVSILFTVQGKVKSVTKPDNLKVYPTKEIIAIDYEVDKNGTYQFIVENGDGTTITKDVIVDTIDKLPPNEFTITATQVENKLVITTNAEDADADGTSVKSGIDKFEYFVKKSTDTEYPETFYTTNEIEGLAYDTYTVYAKAYDKAGNDTPSSNETTVKISNPKVAKYGQKVNYEANEVDDWKIFYINEERNETFIITSGYLPSEKVPVNETGMHIEGTYGASWHPTSVVTYKTITQEVRDRFMMSWDKSEAYDSIKCISRLLDTESWDIFVKDGLKDKGVTAIGSPTLEMWVASWNEVYPEESILDIESEDYGYTLGASEVNYQVRLTKREESVFKLYFPYSKSIDDTICYWLSSPSYRKNYMIRAYMSNYCINANTVSWATKAAAVRPVVCIPTNLLEFDKNSSSWNIK